MIQNLWSSLIATSLPRGCTSLAIVDVNKQGVEAVATELRTTHTGDFSKFIVHDKS